MAKGKSDKPKKGELVFCCKHMKTAKVCFYFEGTGYLPFRRTDGTTGKAKWLVCCEPCHDKADGQGANVKVVDALIWGTDIATLDEK